MNSRSSTGDTIVATQINVDARLRALKVTFMLLTGLGLLAFASAGRLPGHETDGVPN